MQSLQDTLLNKTFISNENTQTDTIIQISFSQNSFTPVSKKSTQSFFSTIIQWIRMTMGIGVMTLPYYVSKFGVLGGMLAILLSGLLSIFSFTFIYEASEKQKISDYSKLVQNQLSNFYSKIFKIFHLIELLCIFCLYCITGWDLFKYFLYVSGFYINEWIVNAQNLQWNEYDPNVIKLRILYFLFLFLILIPLMFVKTISASKIISILFLVVLSALLLQLSIEAPEFRTQRENNPEFSVEFGFKNFSFSQIPLFYSIIMSFYVQPFILSLKTELINPTLKKIQSVAIISTLIESFIFVIFGILGYICFGDNGTPVILMLRPSFENKSIQSEFILRILIFLFFILNNLGLAVFTPTIKRYLKILFQQNLNSNLFISIFPYIFGFIFSIFVPSIVVVFWILGMIVCNFNGFIIPCLLKLKITKNIFVKFFLYLLISFFVITGFVGTIYKIKEFNQLASKFIFSFLLSRQFFSNQNNPYSQSTSN